MTDQDNIFRQFTGGKPFFIIACSVVFELWTIDSLPTSLTVTKVHILIQVFESTKPDGYIIQMGLTHLQKLYTVRLHCHLSNFHYQHIFITFAIQTLGSENNAANLRFADK